MQISPDLFVCDSRKTTDSVCDCLISFWVVFFFLSFLSETSRNDFKVHKLKDNEAKARDEFHTFQVM